ncbi:MAG: iron complex outermembrane receptor protein [Patiriisocius sp.]|jgi:iron complex outermembrane receptor protein
MKKLIFGIFLLVISANVSAQSEIKGRIVDNKSNEGLIGAAIQIKGSSDGGLTDVEGYFTIKSSETLPWTLVIKYLGYDDYEMNVTAVGDNVEIRMKANAILMEAVEVRGKRITAKQQQQALSVETMDVLAIKEAPSGNFYESLGALKGVDVTSASLGFKVVNTRGFNSTSPVRSLQIIDGVDNQSPGLNFSLGNFLGVPDLDVKSVNIIAGASSAFYGPGAFNGVIDMRSKTPWQFPGLSIEKKVGTRSLSQFSLRYAEVFKNKKDKEKFAFKVNLFRMTANDWEAENYDAATDSENDPSNRAGYDAVNIYGDEVFTGGNDYSNSTNLPGLGRIYRAGYKESDIVDYNTENVKSNLGLYYKLNPKTELEYCYGSSAGTTVYQGENRFSLNNITFNQHKIELRKDSVFFIRAYRTGENAGDSYDAVLTAFLMSNAAKEEGQYYKDYKSFYSTFGLPQLFAAGMPTNSENQPNFLDVQESCIGCTDQEFLDLFASLNLAWNEQTFNLQNEWISEHPELVDEVHEETLAGAQNLTSGQDSPFFRPGTQRYDSLFNVITSTLITEGGSKFYDKSSLYHVQGEYQHKIHGIDATFGGNGRMYTPDSKGTIFDENLMEERKLWGRSVWEIGAYVGGKYKFLDKKVTSTATLRLDKSQNFKEVLSPAVSFVYTPNVNHTVRTSFSTALRNPTLSDQYLNLDVGRAILIGNINGVDSLVTISSFRDAINGEQQNFNNLEFFSIDAIKPERAQTFEIGYRGLFGNKIYADVSVYQSWYTDFLGYNIGLDVDYSENPASLIGVQAFRAAANAKDQVTTRGANFGLNYYLGNRLVVNGNVSWNKLDLAGSDDPIIPAFNTPEFKYNLGINGRNLSSDLGIFKLSNWGFGVNYKWIQEFTFEGSPQFSGIVPSYTLLDGQINFTYEDFNTNIKMGASNILDQKAFQVYGGPVIGRMLYFAVTYELSFK